MTCFPKTCKMLLALSAVALLAGLFAASSGARASRRIAANGAAERAFAGEIGLLAAYNAAEERLSTLKGEPAEVPLRPALPLPDDSALDKSESPDWTAFSFGLSWRSVPSRTALELLGSLLNLGDGWRVSKFSLEALDDGESASFGATVVTARRSENP